MNISKINSINFGVIKRSAASLAIRQANGNISKLRAIEAKVQEQKYNERYDIVSWRESKFYNCPYNYYVVKRSENTNGEGFVTLEEACKAASDYNAVETAKAKNSDKNQKEAITMFDYIASRILDSCEE